jgi:hypothetical protein
MIMSQRTSSGSEVLNELGDKIMSRLTTSESNLLLLGVILQVFRNSKLRTRRLSQDSWLRMIDSEKIYNSSLGICRLISKASWRTEFRKLSTD